MCSRRCAHIMTRAFVCALLLWQLHGTVAQPQEQSPHHEPEDQRAFGLLQTPREVQQALASLDYADKEYLRKQSAKFAALSRLERQRFRNFHAELTTSETADRLYGVLNRYQDWLAGLSATERAEILSLAPSERVEAIKRKLHEIELGGEAVALSPEDARAFLKWLGSHLGEHEAEVMARLPMQMRERLQQLPRSRRRFMTMVTMLIVSDPARLPPVSADALEQLSTQLSPAAKQQLNNSMEASQVRELFRAWLITARMHRGSFSVSPERLEDFYENELSAAERDRLEGMSPESMTHELRRMFMRRRFGRPPWGRPPAPKKGD